MISFASKCLQAGKMQETMLQLVLAQGLQLETHLGQPPTLEQGLEPSQELQQLLELELHLGKVRLGQLLPQPTCWSQWLLLMALLPEPRLLLMFRIAPMLQIAPQAAFWKRPGRWLVLDLQPCLLPYPRPWP